MQKFLPKFETILFWVVIILFIFIPLYPKFPLLNVKGTFVAIRIEDLLIAFTLFLWAIVLFLQGNIKAFFKDKLNQTLLLFFFIGGVSLFSAFFVTHTISGNLAFLHYLRRVELMMLLPVMVTAITNKKQAIFILTILSGVLFLVNFYAFGQKLLNWPVISTTNSEFSKGLILYLTPGARVNSTFAGHYDLAVFLTMAIVIISALIFYNKNLKIKVWCTLLLGLSFIVLVLTAARLSFVAVVVGVATVLILSGKRIFLLLLVILAVGAIIYPSQLRDRLISTVTVNLLQEGQRYISQDSDQNDRSRLNIPTLATPPSSSSAESIDSATVSGKLASDIAPGEPINSTDLGVYRSFNIRLYLEWPRAIRAFVKNPFLGTGYSSLGIASDNDLLRSLGEVGLLGTIAFLLVILEIIKRIWRSIRSGDKFLKYFSIGVLSMILAFLLNTLFIDVFEASKVATIFWMIIGLNLAVVKKVILENN